MSGEAPVNFARFPRGVYINPAQVVCVRDTGGDPPACSVLTTADREPLFVSGRVEDVVKALRLASWGMAP